MKRTRYSEEQIIGFLNHPGFTGGQNSRSIARYGHAQKKKTSKPHAPEFREARRKVPARRLAGQGNRPGDARPRHRHRLRNLAGDVTDPHLGAKIARRHRQRPSLRKRPGG